jgi:hypothetical protein
MKICELIFLLITLTFVSCELFEDYDKRTYYDVEGVGYVYYKDTNEPVANAEISVFANFPSHGWATVQPIEENFHTDSSGCYKLKFLKRTAKEDATAWTVSAHSYDDIENNLPGSVVISIGVTDLKNKKNIEIDTLFLHVSY